MKSDATAPRTRRPLWVTLVIHGALIAAALTMLYPLVWMFASSLKPDNEIFNSASLFSANSSFDAYPRGWCSGNLQRCETPFGIYFRNSFLIAGLAVIGNILSCSLAGYAFARLRFRGRNLFFAIMMMTLMLPYQVTLIPQYVLFMKFGWIDTILPLSVPRFLAVDAFFVFLFVQFFRGIPRELDEAAIMDGCGPFRIYVKIMLPLSIPAISTAAIFSFIWTWDDFFAPLVYLNDMTKYTVQLGLRSFIDGGGQSDWSGLFAMSCVGLIPTFLLFLFFQRLLIEGVATTGMKR
jgi:multiple sugar transport system permease protein